MSWLQPDGRKLLAARALRAFGYGYLAVALGLYLQQLGLSPFQVGVVLTAAVGISVATASLVAAVTASARMLPWRTCGSELAAWSPK